MIIFASTAAKHICIDKNDCEIWDFGSNHDLTNVLNLYILSFLIDVVVVRFGILDDVYIEMSG